MASQCSNQYTTYTPPAYAEAIANGMNPCCIPQTNPCVGFTQSTRISGQGPPSADLGNIGDYYTDTLTGQLYGPKTCNGWGTPVLTTAPFVLSYSSGVSITVVPGFTPALGVFYLNPSVIGACAVLNITDNTDTSYSSFAFNTNVSGLALTAPRNGILSSITMNFTANSTNSVTLASGANFSINVYTYKAPSTSNTYSLIHVMPLATYTSTQLAIGNLYATATPQINVTKGDKIMLVIGVNSNDFGNVTDYFITGYASGSVTVN